MTVHKWTDWTNIWPDSAYISQTANRKIGQCKPSVYQWCGGGSKGL